jgi:hypothetical protein
LNTPPLEYESKSKTPPWREVDYYLLLIRASAIYLVVSSLTLPFLDSVWVGKVPVVALIQLPKTQLANWLMDHGIIPAIRMLGLSPGSPSPEQIMARPYALVAAYLIPFGLLLLIAWMRTRLTRRL